MNYKKGDLYWEQISMWDFSMPENVDAYKEGGFHYELMLVTEITSETGWKVMNVKVGELSESQIESLKPKKGESWFRAMGNIEDLK